MPALHIAQVNFFPAPSDLALAEVLEQWPSLGDIAEAVASAGMRVSVIQAGASSERLTRDGINYHLVDVRSSETAAEKGHRLAEYINEIEPDVLHVHGLGFAEEASAVSRYLPELPIVLQDHADRPSPWWQRNQWRSWYSCASAVAFTAPDLARPFTRAGMFKAQTSVFAIPESSSRFTPGSRALARAETGLYGDPCVLWVGHLNVGKDPLVVLDGVARAATRMPGMRLWCAFGSGALLDRVQRRIDRDPQLQGRVHLLGKVNHARVESLMRAADVFVSASRSESCGYALLEAMACGLPPVVTDIPSFRALTGNGRIGRLWPRGDAEKLSEALISVTRNRPTCKQIRAHFDASLSFAAVGRQWAQAYAQVLESRCGRVT
ncbi:glycosyltransferase family 4 protein [Dyella sp. 2HG41-7]|uniref:glycosyltransferase family 4 protein n=1 Tax=Dyella sp. 2HG41-7 TaxID=2883239 RepID=UPI001F401787|nr:glycosyltransferase family 4 protein [Dyella sp. 2HG41-7]